MNSSSPQMNPRTILMAIMLSVLSLLFLMVVSSCSSLRKLKTNVKESSKIDSTSTTVKKVDSSAVISVVKVDSSGIIVIAEFDSTGDDGHTTVEIITYTPHKEDYLQPERTEIKTSRKPKSLTVKKQEIKSNEQKQTTAVQGIEEKKTTLQKTEEKKTVGVKKTKFVFHWWWLLIVLALLLLYAWIKHKLTPLGLFQKFIDWLSVPDKPSFKQNNNMKNFILLCLLSTSLLFGCVAPDKNKTTVTELESLQRPDVDLDWEPGFKDTTGDYAVLKLVNGKGQWVTVKDTTWTKQVKVPRSTFLLQMSVRQVKTYLKAVHYFGKDLIIGISLAMLLTAILIVILSRAGWHWSKPSFGVLLLVVLAYGGCALIIQQKPGELSDNNKKPLSRAEYEYWKKVDPTFDAFWKDQWENNGLAGLYNENAVK